MMNGIVVVQDKHKCVKSSIFNQYHSLIEVNDTDMTCYTSTDRSE
jgi:hypothetical protein